MVFIYNKNILYKGWVILVEDLINKYKQLIYTQIEFGNDETVKQLLIELESCNYMLNFLEDYIGL